VLAVALSTGGASCGGSDTFEVAAADSAADLRFVIPAGAGLAADRGAPIEVLPAALDVRVGDVIEIRNDDDRGHLVGPFFVRAGETLRQRFASAGRYEGACSVHPSGEIAITVR
jgi:plastocyanin